MNITENRLYAIAMWVLTIFFSVIPSIVVYFIKQNDTFVRGHAVQAIHFSVAVLIAGFVFWVLKIILIGGLLLWLLSLVVLGVCLFGVFLAFNGREMNIIPKKFLFLR